jgi:hypothetical protein
VSERGHALHGKHERIEGAQPHRALEVGNREVRLAAAKRANRPARVPRHCQVRIENERAIDEGNSALEIAGYIAEGQASESERDRVILAQLRRPRGKARGVVDLLPAIDRPAVDLAHDVAERRHPMGRGEIRIELDSFCE